VFHWIIQQTFQEDDVALRWVENSRRVEPEVELAIERAWQRLSSRPGVNLFDGAIARCESITLESNHLTICLSKSSYKIAVGTNFAHPEFVEQFGREVMANMFGVSAGVISCDGFLILGRRNASLAHYPNRVHPFAGSLEVREQVNLFDDVRRELREEIGFDGTDIESITMLGIVEDDLLKHPEAIFLVRSTRSKEKIVARIDSEEHRGGWTMSIGEPNPVLEELTPVARAVVSSIREPMISHE